VERTALGSKWDQMKKEKDAPILSPNDLDKGSWGTHPEPDVTLEVSQAAPQEKAEKPNVLTQVSKNDRLEAENLQLRIQLLVSQKENFLTNTQVHIKQRFDEPLKELYAQVTAFQKRLQEAYGIDFTTHAIEPGTGNVKEVK